MSKEYSEMIPLNGSTVAQFQSRAVKAFAALGWKFENFTKIGMTATIPQKGKYDSLYGKLELSFVGDSCEVSSSLAKPPTFNASKFAKKNVAPFIKQFNSETADASASNQDEHEKAMMAALMKANKVEEIRLAAKAAKAAKIKRIKLAIRLTIPLACGVFGATKDGFNGFWKGYIIGGIINEVLLFAWGIFWRALP